MQFQYILIGQIQSYLFAFNNDHKPLYFPKILNTALRLFQKACDRTNQDLFLSITLCNKFNFLVSIILQKDLFNNIVTVCFLILFRCCHFQKT